MVGLTVTDLIECLQEAIADGTSGDAVVYIENSLTGGKDSVMQVGSAKKDVQLVLFSQIGREVSVVGPFEFFHSAFALTSVCGFACERMAGWQASGPSCARKCDNYWRLTTANGVRRCLANWRGCLAWLSARQWLHQWRCCGGEGG